MAAAAGAMAIAQIASTALAIGGTVYSAYSANQSAKAQAQQANINAKMAESQGRVEAERIRTLGQKQASAAKAQMASNGLDLNADNTNVDVIENDINYNSSKDAWTTFFNGKNQSAQYKTDANNFNAQAKNALVSGVLNTSATALNGFANMPKNTFSSTKSIDSIPSNALAMDTSRLKTNATGWA
ncbi:hypothetical protein V6C59_17565 [Acinetobacter bereziniae]|uniref:hypothetical protein n=1 Tax=Acinetobacter bereziniae TaxID=106648 RepID=UPI002FD98A2D